MGEILYLSAEWGDEAVATLRVPDLGVTSTVSIVSSISDDL